MISSDSRITSQDGMAKSPATVTPTAIDTRDSRIDRKRIHQIKEIQTLLKDVYKDTGDGRTLVRELVQNADDAQAQRLVMAVVGDGWPDAKNGLLRGSALVVVNNGPFPKSDRDAMHQAMGGSKAEDAEKVGRFGVGLKSLFHLCEAFVYLGADSRSNTLLPGALNPWAGTGSSATADPQHPDWDLMEGADRERLEFLAQTLLGHFTDGLLLWIPLRAGHHLDRFGEKRIGLGDKCWSSEQVLEWFRRPVSFALLIAQCAHLASIEVFRMGSVREHLPEETITKVFRPGFSARAWVGRPNDDSQKSEKPFSGRIDLNGATWQVNGIESVGLQRLRELRSREDWPRDIDSRHDQMLDVPMKAMAHAAITVLRPEVQASRVAVRLRWAVFLPLDDNPTPRPAATIECAGSHSAANTWEIVLHGYFWPSHDRRSIPGVVGTGDQDGDLRANWNRTLRDELLLPLLPQALESALADLTASAGQGLMSAICELPVVKNHKKAIIRKHLLLPTIQETGVKWKVFRMGKTRVYSVPNWSQAHPGVRSKATAFAGKIGSGLAIIDRDSHAINDDPNAWPDSLISGILDCIGKKELRIDGNVDWVTDLILHVLDKSVNFADPRSDVVARWFVARVTEDCLTPPSTASTDEMKLRWQAAWRALVATLPVGWLLNTPRASLAAVKELAESGLFGPGLVPVPLGVSRTDATLTLAEPSLVLPALLELGRRLSATTKTSASLRKARLVLAETFISAIGLKVLDKDLLQYPLLRVKMLPDSKEEAWSILEMGVHAAQLRVFCGPGDDDDETASGDEIQKDHAQAVTDLSRALGAPAWLVMNSKVALFAEISQPTVVNLAHSVNQVGTLSSEPLERCALIKRLASTRDSSSPHVLQALYTLLTGHSIGDHGFQTLYYVRPDDSNRQNNQICLDLLVNQLRRPWTAVEPSLVLPLPHGLVEKLKIKSVDLGLLHSILEECLQTEYDFSHLSSDHAVHMLRHLYGADEAIRRRWKLLPLHRTNGGERTIIDRLCKRAGGNVEIPAELAGEVRILEPDPGLESLYSDIPILDDDGILSAMLESREPWRFTDKIVRALQGRLDHHILLPQRLELRELLRNSRWLPLKQGGGGLAPEKLLIVPTEMQEPSGWLESAGVLGDRQLVTTFDPQIWNSIQYAVLKILDNPTTNVQVQRLTDAIDLSRISAEKRETFLIFPSANRLDAQLVEDALQTALPDRHQGWGLVRAASGVLEEGTRERSAGNRTNHLPALLLLSRALCGRVLQPQNLINILKELASGKPAKDSPAGRFFRVFIETSAKESFFEQLVLPHIELPTQDGQWRNPSEIARSASGVARRHRLLEELRAPLGLRPDKVNSAKTHSDPETGASSTAQRLSRYFEKWKTRVRDEAVGAFLSLLGDTSEDVIGLARAWLGEDVSVEGVRNALIGPDCLRMKSLKIFVTDRLVAGAKVETDNLLGRLVTMEAGTDANTIFAFDPVLNQSLRGQFWSITLRDVEPARRTAHELTSLLQGTTEWWALHVLQIPPQNTQVWWHRWGTGSQAQLGPVRASILAHLPLILHQLDVRGHPQIFEALRKAQHAQRMREQAQPIRLHEAINVERAALDGLAGIIEKNPKDQEFIWWRVQEQMKRFGYGQESVLLELVQNADDALVQAAEMAGRPLPDGAREVTVRVSTPIKDTTVVDFLHYGRPINSTGGAAFPEGRNREWDQDLYFMLVLNLSGKGGEIPGQNTPSATTGQFGLGFKSVHLVSDKPSVVSGFLAFSIAGGLLPNEHPKTHEADLVPVEGHLPTRIRLPLRRDEKPRELIQTLFRRFAYARALIPAFARAISSVVVDGGPTPGVSRFKGIPVQEAPGWSVSTDTVSLPRAGQWRLLRFWPGEVAPQQGSAAIVVGLRENLPEHFPVEIPFLWSVTPTSEEWGCGYAVNGPFKLDPGRTHVSLENTVTNKVADMLGEALGKSLIKFHESLIKGQHNGDSHIHFGSNIGHFVSELWRVLATGLDSPDPLRRSFLMRLHGPGRGVSQWMSSRSVVPTGLSSPFSDRLPKLNPDTRIEVAGSAFGDPLVVAALTKVDDIAALASKRTIVSTEIARLLAPLITNAPSVCQPGDLLQALADQWKNLVTPDRLHSLRPLADDVVFRSLQVSPNAMPWSAPLLARSKAGNERPFRRLLLPLAHGLEGSDADIQDELFRATFADDDWILAPGYLVQAADVRLFRRLRGSFEVDARTMALWCSRLPESQQDAALRYLLRGRLGSDIVALLAPTGQRPDWLGTYESVARKLDSLGDEHWRTLGLLARLFPEQFQVKTADVTPAGEEPQPAASDYLKSLVDWWSDEGVRTSVASLYEQKAWPDFLREGGIREGLKADSRDHWLGLLVLGACRGLGRSTEVQHRAFLEWAHREGLWEVFQQPREKRTWMEALEKWQDDATTNLERVRWMSLFPTIFQFSRHLDKYKRLLLGAGRRTTDFYTITCLLAPRVDDKLTFAGTNFDAPPAPLNMGLHWILRELVRMKVIDGSHLYPDCWVPSHQLLSFLGSQGMIVPDSGTSNSEKAKAVHAFMRERLAIEMPTFFGAFDIPLIYAAGKSSFEIGLDLENDP